METTTIKLHRKTKSRLDTFRERKSETYDEVINKLVFIADHVEEEPELSRETIKAIEAARERYKKGQFVTEKEAMRRLGLTDV
ncbi:hypothetical protein CL620_03895 [archaeon]|nr:hypothetical protein [archaeon]|tara:strand:+ start:268 stop:516 length:249 start_codon:yes stop_codon:yes gene_type:complete